MLLSIAWHYRLSSCFLVRTGLKFLILVDFEWIKRYWKLEVCYVPQAIGVICSYENVQVLISLCTISHASEQLLGYRASVWVYIQASLLCTDAFLMFNMLILVIFSFCFCWNEGKRIIVKPSYHERFLWVIFMVLLKAIILLPLWFAGCFLWIYYLNLHPRCDHLSRS